MEVRKTLLPGQDGTKSLVQQYGEQLVCVRYRYDKNTQRRLKTIELIVEDVPWLASADPQIRTQRPPVKVVRNALIRVDYQEVEIRTQVKNAGAKWLPADQAWLISMQQVRALKLENRIINLVDDEEPGYQI